jgi:hypothetical protein
MPPGDKPLSSRKVTILRKWISQEAKTAREEPATLDDGDFITEYERS